MANTPHNYAGDESLTIIGNSTFSFIGERVATTYGDCTAVNTTVGPEVTMVTGNSVLILMTATAVNNDGGGACSGWISIAVSGATTVAAADGNGTVTTKRGVSIRDPSSCVLRLTGLTPGINIFTMKYRSDTATRAWQFFDRSLMVIPI